MVAIAVPLGFFAMIVAIVYLFVRKRERILMIEKGANPELFQTKSNDYYLIRYGVIFIGLAIGLFLGNLLDSYTALRDEVCYLSMVLLFGGLSCIVGFYLTREKK